MRFYNTLCHRKPLGRRFWRLMWPIASNWPVIARLHQCDKARWPSGLRRQTKALTAVIWSERAWVRIPLSSLVLHSLYHGNNQNIEMHYFIPLSSAYSVFGTSSIVTIVCVLLVYSQEGDDHDGAETMPVTMIHSFCRFTINLSHTLKPVPGGTALLTFFHIASA